MTAILILGIAAAAVIGLSIVFGGPILGAILAGVLIVGGLIWFVALGGSGTTPREVATEANEHEFFGPGGPDDPSA